MTEQNNSYIGSLGVKEFEERISTDTDIRLIDIRDPIELEMLGVLDWAERITYNSPDFVDRLDALPRDQKYYIYCNSGNRTGHTLQIMQQMWFEYVVHLDGGIQAWLRNNKTVQRCEEGRDFC